MSSAHLILQALMGWSDFRGLARHSGQNGIFALLFDLLIEVMHDQIPPSQDGS